MESLVHLDQEIFLFLNNLGSPTWDWFWEIVTNQFFAIPLYVLLTWLMYKKTGLWATFVSLVMIFVMVGTTYGVSHLIKDLVARPRPCAMGFDMRYLIDEPCNEYSFISTHATSAMALIMLIGSILKRYYKQIFWPLSFWMVLVCYSRIYVGKHYPGDLIAGVIVGFIIGLLFWKLRGVITKKYGI